VHDNARQPLCSQAEEGSAFGSVAALVQSGGHRSNETTMAAGRYTEVKLMCLLLILRCSLNAAVIPRKVSRALGSVRDECRTANEAIAAVE